MTRPDDATEPGTSSIEGTAMSSGVGIEIDRTACRGHGLCFFGWPQFFDLDDDGIAVCLVERVPADLAYEARKAAASCPERAILLREG